MTAARALVETGSQVVLAKGDREYDGPLVTPLGNHVILSGKRPLPGDELEADAGPVGQVARGASPLDPGDQCRDVLAVKKDLAGRQAARHGARQFRQRSVALQINPRAERGQ